MKKFYVLFFIISFSLSAMEDQRQSSTPTSLDDFLEAESFVLPQEHQTLQTAIPQPISPLLPLSEQLQPENDDQSTISSHDTNNPFHLNAEFFERAFEEEDFHINSLQELFNKVRTDIQLNNPFLQDCLVMKYGEKAQQSAQQVFILLQEAEEQVNITLAKVKECLDGQNNKYQIAYNADKIARQKIKNAYQFLFLTHQLAYQWATFFWIYYFNLIRINPYK